MVALPLLFFFLFLFSADTMKKKRKVESLANKPPHRQTRGQQRDKTVTTVGFASCMRPIVKRERERGEIVKGRRKGERAPLMREKEEENRNRVFNPYSHKWAGPGPSHLTYVFFYYSFFLFCCCSFYFGFFLLLFLGLFIYASI